MAVPLKLTGAYLWKVVNHKDVVWLVSRCQEKFSDYGFPEDNIKLVFKSMDSKANGYVTFSEFYDFCRLVDSPAIRSESRVVEMFKEFDPRGLGYINLAGFIAGVVKSGYRHRYDRTVMKVEGLEILESMVERKITIIPQRRTREIVKDDKFS
jgi:hypothetical protein